MPIKSKHFAFFPQHGSLGIREKDVTSLGIIINYFCPVSFYSSGYLYNKYMKWNSMSARTMDQTFFIVVYNWLLFKIHDDERQWIFVRSSENVHGNLRGKLTSTFYYTEHREGETKKSSLTTSCNTYYCYTAFIYVFYISTQFPIFFFFSFFLFSRNIYREPMKKSEFWKTVKHFWLNAICYVQCVLQ